MNNVRLSDLLTAFKGCDKVIFRLTGCGEQEHETAELGCNRSHEALQQENEQLQAQVARVREALQKAREAIKQHGATECKCGYGQSK